MGNRAFSDSDILAKLHYGASERAAYRPALVALDEKRVQAFYRQRGYFSARAEARVTQSTPDFVRIAVTVDEGRPTRIQKIAIRGMPDDVGTPTMDILAFVELEAGDTFNHDVYLLAKERFLEVLAEYGYANARVDGSVRVSRPEHRADIEFVIEPGQQVRFGKLEILGNRRIPDSAILARVAWKPGEPFNLGKLRKTRKMLFGLDVFQSVRIDYDPSESASESDQRADVTIFVREAKRHELALGGGFGVEGVGGLLDVSVVHSAAPRVEARGRGELTIRSWLDPLMSLHLGVRPGYLLLASTTQEHNFVIEARAAITRQDFLIPLITLGVFVSYSAETYDAYSEQGPRTGVILDRLFWNEHLQTAVGAHFEYLFLDQTDAVMAGVELLGTESPLGIASLQQTLRLDYRDDRLNARSGWFAQLHLQEGRWLHGATGSFVRGVADMRGYIPLGERITLAVRARGGWLGASSEDVPITQRFFSGGLYHRGFGMRRLAPVVPVSDPDMQTTLPIGGSALLDASLDLRVDIIEVAEEWLGTAVFVDAGDVGRTMSDIALDDLHVAVGAGIRYHTPIGVVRLDLARRVSRMNPCTPGQCPDPDPGENWVLHVSVGEAF